jgi:hypothetical protein
MIILEVEDLGLLHATDKRVDDQNGFIGLGFEGEPYDSQHSGWSFWKMGQHANDITRDIIQNGFMGIGF